MNEITLTLFIFVFIMNWMLGCPKWRVSSKIISLHEAAGIIDDATGKPLNLPKGWKQKQHLKLILVTEDLIRSGTRQAVGVHCPCLCGKRWCNTPPALAVSYYRQHLVTAQLMPVLCCLEVATQAGKRWKHCFFLAEQEGFPGWGEGWRGSGQAVLTQRPSPLQQLNSLCRGE